MVKLLLIGLFSLAAPKYHYDDHVTVDNKHHEYTDDQLFHKCDMYSIGRITGLRVFKEQGEYVYEVTFHDNIYCAVWFKESEIK